MLIFTEKVDADTLRNIVNCAKNKCDNIICAFSGCDNDGYSYIIYSKNIDISAKARDINTALSGRGGGRNPMIQGSLLATKEEIENYFLPFVSLSLNI